MYWYLAVLKKYAVFSGRAGREEYWYFALFNLVIGIALAFVDFSIAYSQPAAGSVTLSGLYSLFVFIPSIAVSVRRLHDTNRSAWWLLIILLPLIGLLIFLVFMLLESDAGQNLYGGSDGGRQRTEDR